MIRITNKINQHFDVWVLDRIYIKVDAQVLDQIWENVEYYIWVQFVGHVYSQIKNALK